MMKRIVGFSLIELMIVIAIIGILATIAYPSYLDQIRKTRRANAQADLVELASFMERYYSENFTYKDGAANPTLPFTESPKGDNGHYYDLTVVTTLITFTLTATPINDQLADHCGTMTVTHTGTQNAALSSCW